MVAIFDYYARLSTIMLQIIKSLGVLIVALVLFAGCGEALVSQVGADTEKAAGGCAHCEHCESNTKLVDTKEVEAKAADKEVDSKNPNEETDGKTDPDEANKEDDLKKTSQEDKAAN